MRIVKYVLRDSVYMGGLAMLLLALIPLILKTWNDEPQKEFSSTAFLFTYALVAGFAFIRFSNRKAFSKARRARHYSVFLLLFLTSCFVLNYTLPVFSPLSDGFRIMLIALSLNCLLLPFHASLPAKLIEAVSFINGISFTVFAYMTWYTLPFYPVSVLATFLLGLGLHVFVPLLLANFSIKMQIRLSKNNGNRWKYFMAGSLVVLLVTGVYLVKWHSQVKSFNAIAKEYEYGSKNLPLWVSVAAETGPGVLSESVLQSVTYKGGRKASDLFSLMPSGDEIHSVHDPLAIVARSVIGAPGLPPGIASDVQHSWRDTRHEQERQLWSGNYLETSSVESNVKVWPACNISYTDKVIVVSDNTDRSWGSQQEAIYTFHMTEGTVITSLSLWINGVEEPSRLSTRAKADVAYTTIVGVEARDPSVVHWQEGNVVTVRVFPVPFQGSRQFRIGFTAPLSRRNGKLVYANISFEGPRYGNAHEKTTIEFDETVKAVKPAHFAAQSSKGYRYEGAYRNNWQMEIMEADLVNCGFTYEGQSYYLDRYHAQLADASIKNVYLDLNAEWDYEEIESLITKHPRAKFFVNNNGIVELNLQNLPKLWPRFSGKRFSIFPLYLVGDPANSLLVLKPGDHKIYLDQLKETPYYEGLVKLASGGQRIRTFNLGERTDALIASLNELRLLAYETGNLSYLDNLINTQRFPVLEESDQQLLLPQQGMVIRKTNEPLAKTGPDHIMRLYTYNNIMRLGGRSLLNNLAADNELVKQAEKAHIVTPYTSLIVLESQKDYDRFKIDVAEQSLGNASKINSGAAPEPHEWALIVAGLLFLLFTTRRRFRFQFTRK